MLFNTHPHMYIAKLDPVKHGR